MLTLQLFLNSKIFRFAFKEYFPELLGDTRELSKVFFETLSIKPIDAEMNVIFEQLVAQIQLLKSENKETQTIEQEMEKILTEIYSLSETDRALIDLRENSGKSIRESSRSLSLSVKL
ncbi:hypothetical protein QFZ51_004258 [Chitinophaga sp. W3I9]